MSSPEKENLVSVIIPTFNRAQKVLGAVQSVLAQTYTPVEIIVIDDGSTDQTEEVLQGLGNRIKYIQQTNQGVAAARNRGLREATGTLVAFLDSDDIWKPWKLALQVAILEKFPHLQLVFTEEDAINDAGEVVQSQYLTTYFAAHKNFHKEELFPEQFPLSTLDEQLSEKVGAGNLHIGDFSAAMLLGNLIRLSSTVCRRSVLEQAGWFDTTMRNGAEEYEYLSRVCQLGLVGLLDVPAIGYRVGSDDHLSRRRTGMAYGNLKTVNQMLAQTDAKQRLSKNRVRRRLADSYGWVGLAEFDSANYATARPYLWQAIRFGSRNLRTWAYWGLSFLPTLVITELQSSYTKIKTIRPKLHDLRQ